MSQILKGASKMLLIAVITVVVVVAGILLSYPGILSGAITAQTPATETLPLEETGEETTTESAEVSEEEIVEEEEAGPTTHMVEMSSAGFSPNSLTINAGDTVTFVALGSGNYWPASVFHPTHMVYPGSGIDKCQTEERTTIFDACTGLNEGETFSFTFNEVGSWNYHNHNNPSQTGTIVVQ